jgi:hypothetical protein
MPEFMHNRGLNFKTNWKMPIKEPIFVYDPADLLVFETIWHAERYIEPIDAKDGIYFDAEGQILKASTEKDIKGFERTIIRENDFVQYNKVELQRIIMETLEYVNYSRQELRSKTFQELLVEILKFKTE